MLAVGFLMVILSSVLYGNYFPLLVVATYVVAPLPNWICSRAANPDDFMESSGSGIIDFGRFLTGFLVIMGIGTNNPHSSSTVHAVLNNWDTRTPPEQSADCHSTQLSRRY